MSEVSNFLTIEDIKNVCYAYARKYMTYDEPIPSFESRFPDKLESAISIPQKVLAGRSVYSTLPEQGAALFYEMIKLHPFLNGNKRMAFVSLIFFLMINDFWLQAKSLEIYDKAISISKSDPSKRNSEIQNFARFLKNNIIREDFSIK